MSVYTFVRVLPPQTGHGSQKEAFPPLCLALDLIETIAYRIMISRHTQRSRLLSIGMYKLYLGVFRKSQNRSQRSEITE